MPIVTRRRPRKLFATQRRRAVVAVGVVTLALLASALVFATAVVSINSFDPLHMLEG